MFKQTLFYFCFLFCVSFFNLISLSAALPDASLFFAAAEKGTPEEVKLLLQEVDNLAEIEIFTNQLINLLEQKYDIKIDKAEISKSIAKDISYHQLFKRIKSPGNKQIAKFLIKRGQKKLDLSVNTKKVNQKLAQMIGSLENNAIAMSALMIQNFQQFLKGIGFVEERTLIEVPQEQLFPFTEILTGALLCHCHTYNPNLFTCGLFLMVDGPRQSMRLMYDLPKIVYLN